MLGQLSEVISDVSVLRRILFAVAHIPHDYPGLWEAAVLFGVGQKGQRNPITSDQARILFENLSELNSEAFVNDESLLVELSQFQLPNSSSPLGIILISPKTHCCRCGGPLSLRADRPSRVCIYDDTVGTVPGTHYHKLCRKPRCKLYQHYGYHTIGEDGKLVYDNDWSLLPYFISTQKTGFATSVLRRFDADLLIGQVSYKQGAEIYNYVHGYIATTTDEESGVNPTGPV